MAWVCSVSRNSWIFLQFCASAKHHGEDSDPSQLSQSQENVVQCAQKGCSTPCQSHIAAPGSSKKALVSPYCSTQPREMSGLAVSSGTRAGGSSSRGTPPPCHCAPAALHPLLGDKRGWSCSTSSKNICSPDRGMCRQDSPASLATHSTGTAA